MGEICSKFSSCIIEPTNTEIRKEIIIIITDDKRNMVGIEKNLHKYTNYTRKVFIHQTFPSRYESDSELSYNEKYDSGKSESKSAEEKIEDIDSILDNNVRMKLNETEIKEQIKNECKIEPIIEQDNKQKIESIIIKDNELKEESIDQENKQKIEPIIEQENKKKVEPTIDQDEQENIVKEEGYENVIQMIQSPIGIEAELP